MPRQPILGKHSDVDVDADGRARHADGVRAILEDVRDRHRGFVCPARRACPPARFFRSRDPFAFRQKEDRIDRVRVIDVIGRDARGIGSAGRLRLQHFVEEAAFLDVRGENFSFADVLIANRGSQVFPLRIFRDRPAD